MQQQHSRAGAGRRANPPLAQRGAPLPHLLLRLLLLLPLLSLLLLFEVLLVSSVWDAIRAQHIAVGGGHKMLLQRVTRHVHHKLCTCGDMLSPTTVQQEDNPGGCPSHILQQHTFHGLVLITERQWLRQTGGISWRAAPDLCVLDLCVAVGRSSSRVQT
jgi:hypothetical protein